MIERFDHRPMLTAALALSTIVLVVVAVSLAALLITAQQPPAATSSSESGANPGGGAAVQGNSDFYGEGWNSYGHDIDQPQPAKTGTGDNYGEGWNNYGYNAEHAAAIRQAAQKGKGADSPIDPKQ